MNRAVLLLLSVAVVILKAQAADHMSLYVQVIWGTDQEKPAGASYREVGPKLSAKLSPVFRWKHYWETERKKVLFDPGKVAKISLANQRTVEVERLKSGDVEVRLFRRSGLVTKCRQANGRMHILGGEDSSKDSFFVVVRHDEPVNGQ